MKKIFCLAIAMLPMLACQFAKGDLVGESAQFAGAIEIDLSKPTFPGGSLVNGPTIVYDNIPSGISAAGSLNDMNATWGDRVTLADTGYFDRVTVSVFNSTAGGANVSPITSADLNFGFYDANTFDSTSLAANTPLFQFTGNVNFGTLNPGFYTLITFSGLNSFFGDPATAFTLTNSDLMVTQRLSNVVGGSTQAGIVTFLNDTVGTQYAANNNWYRASPAAGTSGYFAFGAPTSNRIAGTIGLTAVPEPTSAAVIGIGLLGLGLVRRHRRED